MSQIRGKTVLITGASSGLGRSMALKMSALGAHIIIWDIDDPNLEKVATEIKERNGSVSPYHCDVSSRSAVSETAEWVKKDVGKVDILINNAGVVSGKPLLECTDKEIIKTMEVNTLAHFWAVRCFLPDMARANSGHIVTIASAGAIIAVPRLVDYSASKFAVFGFDEALRMEIRKQKWSIQTTIVCPYFMNTKMFQGVRTRFPLLLPILDQDKVAEKVVQAVRKNKRRVIVPPIIRAVWPSRLVPVAIFDAVADFLGVNDAMDTFMGRTRDPE
jgi:all-trans-retinol dehydrogenase (NAD+)